MRAMDKRDHKQRYDAGLKTRREVLGAEYVDKAIAAQDEFNRPLQELLNTYCWNDVWNRPGLPRKTRSMLNLAMLSALNKPHELKLHLNGALHNGLTKQDIQEVFLQVAIYCGVPAAVESFRIARHMWAVWLSSLPSPSAGWRKWRPMRSTNGSTENGALRSKL